MCITQGLSTKNDRCEEQAFAEWFLNHSYNIYEPKSGFFEGEGDALFSGDTLFAGFGHRTQRKIYDEIAEFLELKNIVFCKLVDNHFYHLDVCFCPLNDKEALVIPAAFSGDSLKEISNKINIIEVSMNEARKFACNSVPINDSVIIPKGCIETESKLKQRGYKTIPVDMSEFIKAGGAAKCLCLRI